MTSLSHRLYHLLAGAWRRRYVVTVPVLVLPVLGLLVGLFSPRQYTAHTSMLIQETAKMNPFLEDLAVSSMLKERMDALRTLLHSRHILGTVAKTRAMIDDDTSADERDRIIASLSSALSVQMAGKDLIRIDYRAGRPDGIKETLEAVSRQFVEQLLAPERSSMKDSSLFLAEHLKHRRDELAMAERSLAGFKDKHADALPELHVSNMSRLAHLRQRLAGREAELAGATRSLGSLDQQLSKTNPVVGRIEEQIIRIQGELALLRARYKDTHSHVQGALRKLRRLEEERRHTLAQSGPNIETEQLWDIISSAPINDDAGTQPLLISQIQNLQNARANVESLREEAASLRSMIVKLEQQTADFGAQEQQLVALERDLKVKRELYEDLLQRHEMARVTGSLGLFEQEKRVKVIDRPFTPTAPSNLPAMLFVVAGLLAGLFFGAGIALILELTDNSIRRRDQLEALTAAPVLSRIPPMQGHSESVLADARSS